MTENSVKMDGKRRTHPRLGILAASMVALFASGCANTHHVEVGAVPDDYRTRHPIVISEKEHTFDIPVASEDNRLTVSMRETIRGASDRYRGMATGTVRIMTPIGSPNASAASLLAPQVIAVLKAEGVPGNRIITSPYQAASPNDAAPIRISFMATTASTDQCGRWPEDMLANPDQNRNYQNFGCASQANIAAQVANPADLLGPRGTAPIDAERRATAIETYRKEGAGLGVF